MPRSPFALPLGLCLLPLFLSACGEEEPEAYDPEEVIAQAVDFETNFERLDAAGVETVHDSQGTMIRSRMWANSIGAEVFRTLDPSDLSQTVEMPRGAIFLKESYEANGDPREAMQILAKFEEGYYPAGKDWFFAQVTRDGTVLDGKVGMGPEITSCLDCHAQMGERTDLIIGLPPDQLAP